MLFRLHGSILPELVIPLLFVALWTTGICLISRHVRDRECRLLQLLGCTLTNWEFCHGSVVGISSTLLTVLGFIVALSLSFRSTTAYERYMEGRRAWTTLTMVSQNLARNIWINAVEREENEKEDLLAKVLVNTPLNEHFQEYWYFWLLHKYSAIETLQKNLLF